MLRSSELPMLPGNTFKDVKKTRFQKSHHWDTLNGIPILAEGKRSGIGGDPITTVDTDAQDFPSLYPPSEGPKLPSWIVYDGKVLCFMGYFKETLHEVYRANYQVRKVKIYLYLEDGTIQVSEPRIGNSGLLQGCIVSRQRIPRQPPHQNDFITCLDLNVDQTITIFDRCYHITDCDIFTRHFLNRMGISVGDPVEIPIDPGSEIRKQALKPTKSNKVAVHVDTLGKFLLHDRQVLKFNGYWDDRNTMFGYIHEMIVYYFLADDTIQIQEIFEKKQFGRHVSGIFLRRQKLPKEWTGIQSSSLGQNTSYTILNVLGGGLTGGRFIRDGLGIGTNTIDYYKDNDLSIGASINVYAREIILINCDEFTREYYRNKYGIEDFISMGMPNNSSDDDDVAAAAAAAYNTTKTDRVLPIFNGWGTHEDSEGNCKTVEPKPPRIDFNKFLQLDGYRLRFGAKMISDIQENMERIFIISYYLSDDTISVYELTVRNSGFKPGDFFKRSKFFLPNQQWYSSERPKIYTSQNFYIGATIQLNKFTFYIVSADKFCLNYMENHPFEYPNSNIELIMNKIRTALSSQYKQFVGRYLNKTIVIDEPQGRGIIVICHDVIRDAIIELLGNDHITNHEIITLIRYFSIDKNISGMKDEKQCNRETVRSVVHLELQRNLWNDLERLNEHLIHLDHQRSEYMNENTLYYAILACRLPIKPILIRNMFSVLTKNSDGDIELRDFLNFINIHGYKSAPIQPLNLDTQVCSKGNLPFQQEDQFVNWNSFIEKLGLEQQLKE